MIITNPEEIEEKSFQIIKKELAEKNIAVNPEFDFIIHRIIHTTADFNFAEITEIHKDALSSIVTAIKSGSGIYADTNMIVAGVNKKKLEEYDSNIYTLISNEIVVAKSRETGLTRSIIGMEKACEDDKTKIFVVGNAPTALFKLSELIQRGLVKPACIIGVPVGFVGAAESKEEIKKRGIPYIVTNGRKGGSTVAVAILNAILYNMK